MGASPIYGLPHSDWGHLTGAAAYGTLLSAERIVPILPLARFRTRRAVGIVRHDRTQIMATLAQHVHENKRDLDTLHERLSLTLSIAATEQSIVPVMRDLVEAVDAIRLARNNVQDIVDRYVSRL